MYNCLIIIYMACPVLNLDRLQSLQNGCLFSIVDVFFNYEGISSINILYLPLSFFLSLSLFFSYLRAQHTYPIRGAKLINTGTLRFQFRFRVGPVPETGRELEFGTRNTTSDRDSISRISIGRAISTRYFRFTSSVDNRACTDRTCVTRRINV